MRVSQTYHVESVADMPIKQQLERAIDDMLAHLSAVPSHQYLPAWVGAFKRTGTIDSDLLQALKEWLLQAERIALTGAGTPEENGALWRVIQQLEDAIFSLHWKAGVIMSGSSQPIYPRPETEAPGWVFLGRVPPLPFRQTASDEWMDAWGQKNNHGITLMLRYGPGIAHAQSATRSDTAWLDAAASTDREQRTWHAAIELAIAKRLIRVAPAGYCPMVA